MTAAPRRRFLRGVAACTALPAAPQVLALSPMPPVAKPVPMIAPPLRIVVPAAQVPVRLEEVSVHTRVAGRLAQTSVELTFVNPNLQVLEGELQFPLADGQQITGMAMDFAGVMREAVPVGKARGQQVFEDITRTRVDPALAEKTLGNSFRLRVYPLPAQGRKTLVLRYEESLPEQGGRWLYRLPLAYERIARFRWTGTFATAHAPIVTPGAPFDVRAVRGPAGFELSADRQDVRLGGLMEVAVAAEGAPLAVPQDFDGATWFYAEPAVATRLTPRGAPSSVLIAWDASGSAGERSLTRDLALLDAYFSRFRNVDVTLRVFRDRIEAPRAFRVAGGDWQALRRPLEALDHDGASNLWSNVLVLCKARQVLRYKCWSDRAAVQIVEGALLEVPCTVGRHRVTRHEQRIHKIARWCQTPLGKCCKYAGDTSRRNTGPIHGAWSHPPMRGFCRVTDDCLENLLA